MPWSWLHWTRRLDIKMYYFLIWYICLISLSAFRIFIRISRIWSIFVLYPLVELDNRFRWRADHPDAWLEDEPNSKIRIVEFHPHGSFGISNGTTTEPKWNTGSQYYVMERYAENLATYLTIERCNTFLVIRNLTNRMVLTLPQDKHELGQTKFHIALRAIDTANPELNGC